MFVPDIFDDPPILGKNIPSVGPRRPAGFYLSDVNGYQPDVISIRIPAIPS